jgi:hypothetical protein
MGLESAILYPDNSSLLGRQEGSVVGCTPDARIREAIATDALGSERTTIESFEDAFRLVTP